MEPPLADILIELLIDTEDVPPEVALSNLLLVFVPPPPPPHTATLTRVTPAGTVQV